MGKITGRFAFMTLVVTVALLSCNPNNPGDGDDDEDDPVEYTLSGYMQKGPLYNDSRLDVQGLSDSLEPDASFFYSDTIDNNEGGFSLIAELPSRYAELIGEGNYFDEYTNRTSDDDITLRAYVDLVGDETMNLNLLTTITRDRIKKLFQQGASFTDARNQAEEEFLDAFNIAIPSSGLAFNELNIAEAGDYNAILLAVSMTILCPYVNGGADLAQWIPELTDDLKDDGQINTANMTKLKQQAYSLCDPDVRTTVRDNLAGRYAALGVTGAVIPDFEDYIGSIDDEAPFMRVREPWDDSDASPVMTNIAVDSTILIEFTERMDAATIVSVNIFITKQGDASPTSSTLTFHPSYAVVGEYEGSVVAELVPDAPLDAAATYVLTLTDEVADANGNNPSTMTWTFSTP